MPTEFKIPELGENITAGDVVRVLVKAGDTIEKDQPVLELETDKATIEVPSSVSGTIQDVKVKQGDKVKVGQVVLTVGDSGGAASKAAEKPAEKPAAEKTETEQGGRAAKAPTADQSKEAAEDYEAALEIDEDEFQSIGEAAKAGCPVSKALAAVPEINLDATLES